MRTSLFMLVIAALSLAITATRAEEYKWAGAGWYLWDSTYIEPIVAGPFATKDKCLQEVTAVAERHPKDAATLECRYIGA